MISRGSNPSGRHGSPPLREPRRNEAFSLIELLTVIVVITILGALLVSSPTLWRSTGVTTAGNMVMDDMAFARELAVSSNEPTEVWFLRPTGGTLFGATQIYTVDQNGNWTSYGGVHHLPGNVGVDSGTMLSTLFGSVNNNQKSWTSQPKAAIPGYGTSYDAWYIRFMPDGSISQATQNLFLTLHDVALGNQLTALPSNYALINIDYVTGTVTLYRP
jgi:uncharacterized protein (TIGR02596 family)